MNMNLRSVVAIWGNNTIRDTKLAYWTKYSGCWVSGDRETSQSKNEGSEREHSKDNKRGLENSSTRYLTESLHSEFNIPSLTDHAGDLESVLKVDIFIPRLFP